MTDISATVVDNLYRGYQDLQSYLEEAGETSHAQFVREAFRRNLVVSGASLFEQFIKDAIDAFSDHRSNGDVAVITLVQMGVTSRNYHQMFSWDQRNANKFFGYFGSTSNSLGASMRQECGRSKELQEAAKAFMELGELRNELVHRNFALMSFEETVEESYARFQKAKKFVEYVLRRLEKSEEVR